MRRLLWLFMLALAFPAQGADLHRSLLIVHRPVTGGAVTDPLVIPQADNQRSRSLKLLTNLIEATGQADYDVRELPDVNVASMLRSGTFLNRRTGVTTSYDAVVMLGIQVGTGATYGKWGTIGVRRDSLLRPAMGGPNTVPMLWMYDNVATDGRLGSDAVNAFPESCGVGFAGPPRSFSNGNFVQLVGGGSPWPGISYIEGTPSDYTKVGGGGLRIHARQVPVVFNRRDTDCVWCDSILSVTEPGTSDTLQMWERPNTAYGGAPLILARVAGSGAAVDSASGSETGYEIKPGTENDLAMMMLALARLDSVSGGKVLGKQPITMALVMDYALSRGNRAGPHGPFEDDSDTYYAGLDSLASLNLPMVVAVNVDSASFYPTELAKLKALTKARFTPFVTCGAMDSTAVMGNADDSVLVDVFGRFRKRWVAAGDTSIVQMYDMALSRCDSLFGRGRRASVLVAPFDDYSPPGATHAMMDTLIYEMARRGVKCIVSNFQNPASNYATNHRPAEVAGWWWNRGFEKSTLGHSVWMDGHAGRMIAGSRSKYVFAYLLDDDTDNDSTAVDSVDISNLSQGTIGPQHNKAWIGATQTSDFPYDIFAHDYLSVARPSEFVDPLTETGSDNYTYDTADRLYPPRRAGIVRFCTADFSGIADGPPAYAGWWTVKWLNRQMQDINHLAGRTVIKWVYPEEGNKLP